MRTKKYYYFLAIRDIVRLFGEQELCSECEVNVPAVINYIDSYNFNIDTWDTTSKEELYQKITDDILDGYPVWRLLDIPEYKMNILEKELSDKAQKELEQLKKTYKCYTCKYFNETVTSIGILRECNWKASENYNNGHEHIFKLKRNHEPFNPKKRCKKYERKEDSG